MIGIREWKRWSPVNGSAEFLVFDSAAKGGNRMSSDTVTRAEVVERVRKDPGIENAEERCEIYRTFVQWSDLYSPEEYVALEFEKLADELELKKNNVTLLKLEYDKNLRDLELEDEIKALQLSSLEAQLTDAERLQKIGGATQEEVEQAELNLKIVYQNEILQGQVL